MELKKRIYFVFAIFSFCFMAIVFKAFKVQVIDKEHLISKSKKQFLPPVVLNMNSAPRKNGPNMRLLDAPM